MTTPAGSPPVVTTTADPRARRFGLASVLMVPALLLSLVVSTVVGYAIMGALDVADTETLYSAGAVGYLAAVLVALVLVSPQLLGVWLGLKARRLGETGLGTAGLVANGVIAGFLLVTMLVNAIAA
jgi:hypothetical protein